MVKAWHRLLGLDEPERRYRELTVKEVFDPFIQIHAHEPRQHTAWILGRFQKFVGPGRPVTTLIPNDLSKFFEANLRWSGCTRKTVVNHVLAAINHAVEEALLDKNPISSTPGFKRSSFGQHIKRKGIVPVELRQKLEAAAAPALTQQPPHSWQSYSGPFTMQCLLQRSSRLTGERVQLKWVAPRPTGRGSVAGRSAGAKVRPHRNRKAAARNPDSVHPGRRCRDQRAGHPLRRHSPWPDEAEQT